MKKRMLSFLLALCLIVGMLPVIALAEAGPTAAVSYYNYTNDKSTSLSMKAGDATKYFTTGQYNTTLPNNYYIKATEDTINWNVKFEYPADGVFTVTLKDATIKNYVPLKIDVAQSAKVILEGTNYLKAIGTSIPLAFAGSGGTATITGSGKLTVDGDCAASATSGGLITSSKSLILDNANVHLYVRNGTKCTHMFHVNDGDLTIKGGVVTGLGYTNTNNKGTAAVFSVKQNSAGTVGGNVYIQDGAAVRIVASIPTASSAYAQDGVEISGKLYVTDSTLEIANVGQAYGKVFSVNKADADGDHIILNYSGDYTVQTSGSKGTVAITYITGSTDVTTYKLTLPSLKTLSNEPPAAITDLNYFKVSPVHEHIAGPKVYEGGTGICSEEKVAVTYCTVCHDVLSRTNETVTSTYSHTPGTPALKINKVTAVNSSSTATERVPSGSYVMETYCTNCGKLLKSETTGTFDVGLFYYITSNSCGGISTSSSLTDYKPKLILNPGETKYFITKNIPYTIDSGSYAGTYKDPWYLAAGSADDWTVKMEYPVYGNPILTLKGAKLMNDAGLYYGVGQYICRAPLTIVVEEDSTIASRMKGLVTGHYSTYNGALNLYTTADVTITGPGKLTLSADENEKSQANMMSFGNIIFDNANVEMLTNPTTWPNCYGIWSQGGDITIKGSTLSVVGCDTVGDGNATAFKTVLRATAKDNKGGNITIQDGSNVSIIASTDDNNDTLPSGAVLTDGAFTIKDSNVEFALAGNFYTGLFDAASMPKLEFTKAPNIQAHTYPATYDAETGVLTKPTNGKVDFSTYTGTGLSYFRVQMIGEIEGTAVTLDNTLKVDFAFDKVITGTDGYVEFVKNGETTKKPLADCVVEDSDYYVMTFPGVSAKEMNETITVTVYAADGTAVSDVYSDSIEAYALRMLRNRPDGYTDAQYAALKTLLVDMLNYGAAAQGHFGYNKNDLINAELKDEEKALGTPALKTEAPKTPASATAEQGYLGTAFELKSSLGMAIALDSAILPDVTKAKVTFTDYQGKAQEFTVSAKDISSTEEYLVFVFGDLVAGNGRQDITWTFYDAENVEKLTVTDSLAAYVGRNMEKYAFLADILIYCDSAAAYFNA